MSSGTFNRELLAKFLIEAQGMRSINQYSLHAAVSATYISELRRGLIKKAPGIDVIKKLSSKAYNDVTYEDFMYACGYLDNQANPPSSYHNNRQFGKHLKMLRINKNMTQEELATILGLSKASVSRYENNSQLPELAILSKIADYFNTSIDYLLGREVNTTTDLSTITAEYLDIKEYIKTYNLSKEQIKDILEHVLKLQNKFIT